MTREDLIQLLKEYKENKARLNIKLKELKVKRLQLKGLEEIEVTLSSTSFEINSDIHSKNTISDKTGNKVVQNETKKEEVQQEIEELEKDVKQLRDKVEAVDDRLDGLTYKEKEILVAYYIEEVTAEDIGNNLYLKLFNQTRSDRHIQRIIEKATDKMLRL